MTQKQLTEHISRLRTIAGRLREVAAQPRLKNQPNAVPVIPEGLQEGADQLDEVADDLTELISDAPVSTT